jgi:hypothetical protein
MSTTQPNAAAPAKVRATPLVVSAHAAFLWLLGTAVMAMLAYYFIGLDQGMTSVFGANSQVHEFVHDARHFLGFPCH